MWLPSNYIFDIGFNNLFNKMKLTNNWHDISTMIDNIKCNNDIDICNKFIL